ncbi:hypothetical protein JOB18_006598 [Solea senegalensis]|uniref:Uncharacterized protein n=1 Tax=Solea senegalensis TaxID=28829 RepID=A0AAV6SI08_SOLSE|nr:hypothetical protein JOB18_006598 [Solea senegalensis]
MPRGRPGPRAATSSFLGVDVDWPEGATIFSRDCQICAQNHALREPLELHQSFLVVPYAPACSVYACIRDCNQSWLTRDMWYASGVSHGPAQWMKYRGFFQIAKS